MLGQKPVVLVEAKSPSVMKRMGESLPAHGIKLNWEANETLALKNVQKVSTRILKCNANFDIHGTYRPLFIWA
jgi:hypothetical protein